MRNLKRNQWLKSTELKKLQDKKLRALIDHSYKNVPYYHFIFKNAKIKPDDIKTVDDLKRIPVSRKEDIRDLLLEEITAKNIDLSRCHVNSTSGTTGIPLTIYWVKRAWTIANLETIEWMRIFRNKLTDRIAVIGQWFPVNHPLQKIGVYKTIYISPFDDIGTRIEEIRRFKPNIIVAYPSCLRILAGEIRQRDIQGIKSGLALTSGEVLYEYTRELVKDVFGAEIFDLYGTREVGNVSFECDRREGYHIQSDSILVEITQNSDIVSFGEQGEVTVTNLINYAMPMIRYNLEDTGILLEDKCSCGRSFPLMKITGGRKTDTIQLPDGRIISTLLIPGCLLPVSGLKQFKIVQEKRDLFLVKVVKDSKFTDRTVEEIKQRLKDRLGEVKVDVLVVDEIPREKSGKFKPFITRIPVNYDG